MRTTNTQWTVRLWLVGFGLFALLASSRIVLTAQTPVVYVAPIEGMIDLGLAPFRSARPKRSDTRRRRRGHSRDQYLRRARRMRRFLSATLC